MTCGTRTGKPRDPNSNMGKLRAFFLRNKDEELQPQDIAVKLGISLVKTHSLIQKLKKQGICETAYVVRARRQV